MENFTPIQASIGGALIGLSAVLLMALNGQIAGISGIVRSAAFGKSGERGWRIWFLVGVVAAPVLWQLITGAQPPFEITASWPLLIGGGLLVGFGTRLGSGCTSGHGVCGLSRLSPRSMVAVALFMAAGMLTVAVLRAVMGS